eukprot:g19358.t2
MSRLRELWRSASAGSPNSAVACWLHCADELTIEVLAQLDYDAYVNTKAQADALVAACRYAPQGERSWGPTRAMLKERVSLKGYAQQMRDPRTRPVTLAMIETRQGLGNLPDILTSEVDGVFIGPMDLSCSLDEEGLGTAGPKTSKAIARIKALAHRQGKVVGIYVSDRSSTEHYISKGFQFVVSRVFFTSPAPGTLADAFGNDFYQSDEVFVNAIGAAMAKEYQAIHELGFKVQIDWLASTLTEGADRLAAQHQVQVLNGALQGLEAEQLRLQLRWEAPPSPALLQVLLEAEVKYVALETCQVERAPEEELWKKVKIPKDKVLLVGTINPCDRHVEHPRRIAQRLETFAEIVGWDSWPLLGGVWSSFCSLGSLNYLIRLPKPW